ncbi:MAG: hypothetical protein LBN74_04110 [Prevotella sp.]|nr:hypothetical protein [Prevotella sp.]
MSSILYTKAQTISLPDAAGKYLFDLMINRGDISKSTMYGDKNNYTKLYKRIWLPSLQENLKNASEEDKKSYQEDIENIDQIAEQSYIRNNNRWATLMKNVDRFNITSETATYYKTFFRFSQNQDGNYSSQGIDVFVSLVYADNIYAFYTNLQWIDNRWIIMETDPEIYRYTQDEYDEVIFHPETNIEEANNVSYEYRNANIPAMRKSKTITSPNVFNQNIVKSLKKGVAFGSGDIFLNEKEYMGVSGNIIIKQLNKKKEKGELEDEFLAEINTYLDNPSSLFSSELKEPWTQLQETLKEEFNGDISHLTPYETVMEIYNWDNKFIEMNNITVRTNINFEQNEHKAGIIFEAIWYNGIWKLSYVQPYPYGIDAVDDATMDDAVPEEDIISVNEY